MIVKKILMKIFILGHSGLFNSKSVAANVIRGGIFAHGGTGKTEIWSIRVEHSIRVQRGRLFGQCPIHSEPFR